MNNKTNDNEKVVKKNNLNDSGISDSELNKRSYFEDFKDFYMFAHEFLALACNSRDRLNLVLNAYVPNFNNEVKETIKGLNLNRFNAVDANKFFYYEMTDEDLKGDCRPHFLLLDQLEEDFFEHIPKRDEGFALSNNAAGFEINKNKREILGTQKNEYQLKKSNLRDSLYETRTIAVKTHERSNKFMSDVFKRRQIKNYGQKTFLTSNEEDKEP